MILNLTPDTPSLPDLPELQGADEQELALEVYTGSLNPTPDELQPGFGNANRLCTLGSQALSFIVTRFYFRFDSPQLASQAITEKVNDVLQGEKIIEWLGAYPILKNRLRLSPGHNPEHVFHNIGEASRYFHTYLGALLYCRGLQVVENWIVDLLSLAEGVKLEDDDSMMQDPIPPASSSSYGQAPPPDYSAPQPPPPASNAAASGSSSIPMSLISLSIVHETATRRQASIDYAAESVGPAHTPQWTVRCRINGEVRGQGTSTKQKTAKEEAARRAFIAMGWAQ